MLVGAGRFELPTSWSQTRRATAAPRPAVFVFRRKRVVPPGRLELPHLAPEASALSAELRGLFKIKNNTRISYGTSDRSGCLFGRVAPTTSAAREEGYQEDGCNQRGHDSHEDAYPKQLL